MIPSPRSRGGRSLASRAFRLTPPLRCNKTLLLLHLPMHNSCRRGGKFLVNQVLHSRPTPARPMVMQHHKCKCLLVVKLLILREINRPPQCSMFVTGGKRDRLFLLPTASRHKRQQSTPHTIIFPQLVIPMHGFWGPTTAQHCLSSMLPGIIRLHHLTLSSRSLRIRIRGHRA